MPYGENRTNTNDYRYQRTLDAPTQKLFKAIDDENLEAFKQALEGDADVNAFDEEGMTPLMSIARACDVTYGRQPMLEKMAKLLIQNSSIDINAQSREYVYEERQKKDSQGHVVFQYLGKEIVRDGFSGSKRFTLRNGRGSINASKFKYIDSNEIVTKDDNEPIWFTTDHFVGYHEENIGFKVLTESYDGVKEEVRTPLIQKNTALHIPCQVGARDMVKILLTHPGVETDIRNCKHNSHEGCLERSSRDVIKLEFEKAQKGRDLLGALSSGNIYQAKRPLNQEFNPNCWKRNLDGEIETPLSLICLQGRTQDNKEVLTKLLKHKDLDFSQIKPMPAIEQNRWVKQIIKQAITERLTDTINSKDLDDVKELVENNCFINHAIVTDALRSVDNPNESITNYLNEKFPASAKRPVASTNNIPVDFEQFVQELSEELEKTKTQLTETERELAETKQKLDKVVHEKTSETSRISQLERDLRQVKQEKLSQQTKINDLNSELIQCKRIMYGRANDTVEISQLKKDLKQVKEERDRLSSENRRLCTESLSNKNKKPSQAISPGKKQSNCASASFLLSGAFAVGACLAVLYNYPVIGACLTAYPFSGVAK
ncbi:MAG: ankyrin repeat domain-containing protein [Wolbachia sp.]